MIVYDAKNQRLAIFQKKATPDFWDEHWQQDDLKKAVSSKQIYHFLKSVTAKYLKPGTKILEGGCGIGQVVFNLQSWGYKAYGVDFAEQTIQTVKNLVPNLKLTVQDVRKLDFPDHFFDGYWSLGVIEHFYEGYDEITNEMARVLKPGGYLFLTFPVMSPLRKLKARLHLYPKLDVTMNTQHFYEFMLNPDSVKKNLKRLGFTLMKSHPYDALKGLKDEVTFLQPVLQRIYNGKGIFTRGTRFLFTVIFARITGHMMLFVLKKK